jgi:hypothetical protein
MCIWSGGEGGREQNRDIELFSEFGHPWEGQGGEGSTTDPFSFFPTGYICIHYIPSHSSPPRNNLHARVHASTVSLWQVVYKVHIYIEYHSVCPLVGIGAPPLPLPQTSVPLPRNQRGGGRHTRLRVREWYGPKDMDPYQNITDPQHCFYHKISNFFSFFVWQFWPAWSPIRIPCLGPDPLTHLSPDPTVIFLPFYVSFPLLVYG